MALFRRFFYRKPPDRLLEISERVYVFDCCFSTDVMEEDQYKLYLGGIVEQLQDYFPDSSFMVFNFREGDRRSQLSDILTQYDMTVMDYPRQYEGCPLLPLEMVHHFLRSSESWLSLEGQQNVLLMHCERGGWPVLAFMLAGLLLYRRQYSGEQKTLEMIYKQAPRELLHFLSTLNPYPSQLRYLQYISRRNFGIDWPPADTPLVLDCLMLRAMPVFEGGKGCRPVVRVYGQDPSKPANRTSKLLYSTSKTKKHIRQYVQEESMLVKVDLRCRVQGDVVIECINLDEDLQQEQMVFRLMFHTAFVRANILMLSRDDIDILWDAKDQFSRDFRAEVLFADADTILPPLTGEDLDDSESASPEEFYEVEEIFTVDAPESKGNFDSHKTKKASHLEYAEVVREEVDVHSFEDCRGDDVNHKQSRKLNSNVDAVKDIAVDDVKYRIDEKEVSDLEAVKDIAVDNGNIKFGPTSAISDVRINEETELITYEAAKEFKETEDKADRASSSNLKLDPSVLLQKLTAEFDREKPEKLEQPSPLWNFVAKTKPPESMLARQKKQGFMLGDNLRQIKPDSPPLWVLNNKGPASSPMNLPHPPSRYNSAPPDFPVPHVLEESTAGANVKLSSNADDQGQAASILVSPVSSGLPPPPPPPLHSLASAVLAPRSLIPPPPPPPPFMSSSQVKVEIVSQSAVPKSAPPPPPGTHFNTGHNNGMTLASPPPPSWKSLHVSTPTPPPLQSSYGSRITTSEPSIEPPSTQSLQLVRGTPRIPPPPPPPPYLPSRSATVPPPPPPPPPPPYFSSTSPPPPPFIQENVVRHIPPPPPPPPRVEQGDLTPPVFERVPLPPPPPQGAASLPPPPPPQPSTRASSPSPPPPPPPPPPTSAMYGVPPPPPPPSTMYGAPPPPQLVCKASPVPPPPPPTMGRFPPPPPPPPPSLSGVPLPPPPPPTMSRAPPPPPPPSMFGTPPPPPLPPPSMSGAPPPPPPPPPPSMSGAPPPPPPPPPSMSGVPPPPPPPPSMSGAPPPPPPPPFGGAPPPPPMPGAPPPPPMPGAPPPPPPPGGGRGPPPPPPPGGGRGPPPPPPPGGGGPGAPPPPPLGAKGGGRGRGRGMGAAAPRRSSLKPLHWSKVTRAIQGSLWEELQRHGETQIAPEFDVSEIETLFSAIVPKPADSGRAKKKSAGSKPEKVQLIDLRRANNTEIMLTKVKMPLPDMMAAILALDESVLDVDQVDNLIKFCPTKEEMEQLKNYTGDKDNLGRCEQYFLELMKVPRVESKLRVFSFKIQFNTQISEFKRSLTTVNSACDEVRNSVKLKEIMKKILYLGNTLNQGTARGAAVGFKLDSLLKLTDTRASTSKMTLMHYLCKVLAAKSPPLLDFHLDLVSLETATKIQLKSLAEEMQAIIKGLEKVKQENAASANDGPVSDVFRKALKNFISSAESEVASVTNLYSVVGRNADALALYFGEDPARYPFEQVTATLLNFVKLFRKAHDENVKQAEQDKKKAEKEAEMEKARTPKKAEKDAEMEKASTPKKSDT